MRPHHQVTSGYAVLNLAAIGPKERWTELVHVDWRAWPVGLTDPPAHNYEVRIERELGAGDGGSEV